MKSSLSLVLAASLALAGCSIFDGDKKPRTPTVGERLPVLSFDAVIAADPALASVAVVLPPPAANAEWGQPGGNAAKSLSHLEVGTGMVKVWSISIGSGSTGIGKLNAGPVVSDGRLFTLDTQATVRAFDAKSGASLWQSRIDASGEKRALAFGGGVSVADGRVYVTTGYGIAVALDAQSGRQIWKMDGTTPLRGAPTVDGNRLFVMTQDNQMFALSSDKGERLWESTGTVEVAGLLGIGSPAVGQDTVVVGFSSGELSALRVENGRPVWQDALARTGRSTALAALADIDASPVIDRGRVFAVGHGGRMAALDLATGQRVWEQTVAGISTPWVAGDYVYVVTLNGELMCLNRTDGKIRWLTQMARWENPKKKKNAITWNGPILASDRLIMVGSNGQMVAMSPYTGALLAQVTLATRAYVAPAVAGGTLYVLTDDGKLTAYR